jgi:hypothetical protein
VLTSAGCGGSGDGPVAAAAHGSGVNPAVASALLQRPVMAAAARLQRPVKEAAAAGGSCNGR